MNNTIVDENRLVEMYENGVKVQEIADELGVSRSLVYDYLRKNRVEWRRQNDETSIADRDSKVIELYGEGKQPGEIAKTVGICRQTVSKILTQYGLYEPKRRGINSSPSKKKSKQTNKKCPVCKAVNNPKEAKFCCMCGTDIRSEADVLIERLNKAYKACCALLPGSVNEEVRNTISDATKYIERHREV